MTQVSEVTVRRWKEFNELLASDGGLEVLTRRKSDDTIFRIKASILSGGTDSGEPWDSSVTYDEGDIVIFNGKFYESKQDNNLDHVPNDSPTDPWWKEVPVSTANGFGRYEEGVYSVDPTAVIRGNDLYVIDDSVTLPFNSTDFDEELGLGIWKLVGNALPFVDEGLLVDGANKTLNPNGSYIFYQVSSSATSLTFTSPASVNLTSAKPTVYIINNNMNSNDVSLTWAGSLWKWENSTEPTEFKANKSYKLSLTNVVKQSTIFLSAKLEIYDAAETLDFEDLNNTPSSLSGQGGKKLVVSDDETKIEFAPSTTSSGFYNIDDFTIDFDGSDFTLQGTGKIVAANEKEYTLTNPSITLDYTGDPSIIYIYFDDNGVLRQSNDLNRQQQYDLMLNTLPVSYLLYNPLNTPPITYVGDYRKLRSSNKLWVKNLYDKQVYALRGIDVFDLTIGNGNADSHVQFGLTAGDLLLVDRRYPVPTRNVIDKWNVGYFNGGLKPRGIIAADYPVITDVDLGVGSTGLALHNNDGSPVSAGSGDYVWYFVIITNDITSTDRTLSYMGNSSYGNLAEAEGALANEVSTLENRLTIRQGAAVRYGVLLQTKSTYANTQKSRIVEVLAIEGEATGSPTVTIPSELVNGSDASSLHNHNSLYKALYQRVVHTASTAYVFVANEIDSLLQMTSSSSNTVTIQPESALNLPYGTRLDVEQNGIGTTTIVAGSGVTINNAYSSLQLRERYSVVSILKTGIDEWTVTGDFVNTDKYDLSFALSDEITDITTDNDGEIEVIRTQTIESITFAVNTAPTGSPILVDVLKNGSTILTGSITLPIGSKTVTVASPQINNIGLSVGDRLKADITQIGATVAGAGAKIYFKTKA